MLLLLIQTEVHRLLIRELWWDWSKQSRAQQLSSCSTERPLGCCPAPGSVWGAGRLQGIEAGTVFFLGWTFRWWKEPNSSPIYSGTTGLLVLVGRELLNCSVVSFIFLSWRVCLEADGVSSLWGDAEPLAEGLCKMCNLHHRRWPWKMVYIQTQWGVSSATAYGE